MKKIHFSTLAIIIGVVALVVLAQSTKTPQVINKPSPSPSPKVFYNIPDMLPKDLTDDEKFILNPPLPEAPKSEKEKHAATVAKLAEAGSVVEIQGCNPKPLVLQVKVGSSFEIKNEDTKAHKFIFDEDHSYDIPAHGSKTIKADFKYGAGDYGYVCNSVGITGFLHLTT